MIKKLKTPQAMFVLLAIFILVIGAYKKGTQLDLNYFLNFLYIDVWSVAIVSSVFFILMSVNYASLSIVGKKPHKMMTIAHIGLQIIALLPLVYFMMTAKKEAQPEKLAFSNTVLLISFVVFVVSVILHLINFFFSMIKRNNS